MKRLFSLLGGDRTRAHIDRYIQIEYGAELRQMRKEGLSETMAMDTIRKRIR